MELRRIQIEKSPSKEGRVRLSAEVAYGEGNSCPEVYWIEFPEKYAEFLSRSGDPWLACLLPLAMKLGEPLRINEPVDKDLLKGVQELMEIWKAWYPHLHIVPIETEVVDRGQREAGGRTASFFSGGVDSFFTVLRHRDGADPINIDDLLFMGGFEIPLRNADAYGRMCDTLERAAAVLGKELVRISTNFRETRLREVSWLHLSHGCAMATVALALSKRYDKVLIASDAGYKDLQPCGSHPLTDPLFLTTQTKILHDGARFDRVEKLALICQSEVAMRSLHVCWKSRSEKNCCACRKCYRTMLILYFHGALGRCKTMQEQYFDLERVSRIYSPAGGDARQNLLKIRVHAVAKGRRDIIRNIDRSLKRSKRIDRYLSILRPFTNWRFIWRLERACIGDSITF